MSPFVIKLFGEEIPMPLSLLINMSLSEGIVPDELKIAKIIPVHKSNAKDECLHTGHGNEDAQYTMGGTVLNTSVKAKDLRLTISADMKVSEQCGIAAAKGNQILGLIRRNIVYKEKELPW